MYVNATFLIFASRYICNFELVNIYQSVMHERVQESFFGIGLYISYSMMWSIWNLCLIVDSIICMQFIYSTACWCMKEGCILYIHVFLAKLCNTASLFFVTLYFIAHTYTIELLYICWNWNYICKSYIGSNTI